MYIIYFYFNVAEPGDGHRGDNTNNDTTNGNNNDDTHTIMTTT